MYLDSKDFQTVWALAHNWTGFDPEQTDPANLPQEIKDSIHRLLSAIWRQGLTGRTKRFAIFMDESFLSFVMDFKHFLRFYKCIKRGVFDKDYLNSIYVRRPEVIAFCEKEYLTVPPIWRIEELVQHMPIEEQDDENQGWYEELSDPRKRRVGCLEVAKRLWAMNQNLSYEQVYHHPDMRKYGNPGCFSFNAFKKWARPIASEFAKKGGRPKTSSD